MIKHSLGLIFIIGFALCAPEMDSDTSKTVVKRYVCGGNNCNSGCNGNDCNICNSNTCCQTRRCNSCYNSCTTNCYTMECRQNCVDSCSNCNNNNHCHNHGDKPTINIINDGSNEEKIVNLTTQITIENRIENTNIIKSPIYVNTTNINNITVIHEEDEIGGGSIQEKPAPYPVPVPIRIPQPYPVPVPHQVPVPVHVPHRIPVPVPYPVPVRYPIHRPMPIPQRPIFPPIYQPNPPTGCQMNNPWMSCPQINQGCLSGCAKK